MTGRPRVLVTNDDGIASGGLHRLAAAARELDLDVVVAAPLRESSGQGAGIGAAERHNRVVVEERSLPNLPDVPVYAVAASPGFIALIATRGAFGPPPDIVMSGINRGANVGRAVLHSGTVGAVLTAHAHGRGGLAVSLDVGLEPTSPPHWDSAAAFAGRLLPQILASVEPLAINLNVPDAPVGEVRGLRRGTLAAFGAVQTKLAERGQGFLRVTIADAGAKHEPGTDAAWLADGYASVTPLRNITEEESVTLDL